MESVFSTEPAASRASLTKKFLKTLVLFWTYGFVTYSSVAQLTDSFEYMYEDVRIRSQSKHYRARGPILPDHGNIPLFQMTFICVLIMDAFGRFGFAYQLIRGKLQKPRDFFAFGTMWSVLIPTLVLAMAGQYCFGGETKRAPGLEMLDMQGNIVVQDDRYRRLDLVRKGRFCLVYMVISLVLAKILKDRCKSPLAEAQVKKDEKNEDSEKEAPLIVIEPDHVLEESQTERN